MELEKVVEQKLGQKIESQKIEPKKDGPLSFGWIHLIPGKGIKWVLWKTSVTLQRQEKQGDNWLTTEELHVAPQILKEIAWRIPGWLEAIDKNNGKYNGRGGK